MAKTNIKVAARILVRVNLQTTLAKDARCGPFLANSSFHRSSNLRMRNDDAMVEVH